MENVKYVHNGCCKTTSTNSYPIYETYEKCSVICMMENSIHFYIVYSEIHYIYISIQHWIKKVNQSCPKTRMHFGFRTTMMKGYDLL